MREENNRNGMENLASQRIHGVLPKKYHMKYRSGQEDLVEEYSLKEIEEMIRQTGENIEVPESLLPENMEKLLLLRHKKRKRRRWIVGILLGILLCLVAFGTVAWKNRDLNQGKLECHTLSSFGQLYDHYVEVLEKNDPCALYGGGTYNLSTIMKSNGDTASSAQSIGAAQLAGYTTTNVREEGIGEADFTVTDGKNIYTVCYCSKGEDNGFVKMGVTVTISQTKAGEVSTIATIQKEYLETGLMSEEPMVYVYGNVLALVHCQCLMEQTEGGEESQLQATWEEGTCISFYDISDPTQPKLLKENIQSGSLKECREVGGNFYVVTMKSHIQVNGRGKEPENRYIPMLNDEKIPVQDIYLQDEIQGNAFDVISTWNLKEQGVLADIKAVVGFFQELYMTEKSIYLSTMTYGKEKRDVARTQIVKLSLNRGKIQGITATGFPGTMENSFAIQEHDDELWVTVQREHFVYREDLEKDPQQKSTAGSKTQKRDFGEEDDIENLAYWYDEEEYRRWTDVSVYTFDDKLNRLDSLDGLVRDEEIYAVRYVGEVGYFVSYEQVDPLVSVDLSDPHQIRLLDELVMPGFSTYLHPLQDDLMLGVGRNDEWNIKLDLYDISNPTLLSRIEKKEWERMDYCSVLEDYKWIMVDEENQLIGMCMGKDEGKEKYRYDIFHYDRQEGLTRIKTVPLESAAAHRDFYYGECWQGFRIGDYLYLVEKQAEKEAIQVVELE